MIGLNTRGRLISWEVRCGDSKIRDSTRKSLINTERNFLVKQISETKNRERNDNSAYLTSAYLPFISAKSPKLHLSLNTVCLA